MDSESSRILPVAQKLPFAGDLSRESIGAFYEVYNTLRFGLLESAYARAMEIELLSQGIPVEREVPLLVHYKGHEVGVYRADLVVDRRLILELKTQADVDLREKRQLLHYLRITNMRVGLLMNFGPEAKVLRVVNG